MVSAGRCRTPSVRSCGVALSKSAVDRLGERLRSGAVSDDDWALLEELRDLRRRHLDEVLERVRSELGLEITGRVKTTGTLVDKLQREGLRLSQMDDVAGARIVVDGSRLDQDLVVQRLRSLWTDSRQKDRRSSPVHGYRAVHLIASLDGWPLEVQVRTVRQDEMANLLESLADRWGRQIRYGAPPDQPESPVLGEPAFSRVQMLGYILDLADVVADVEELAASTQRGANSLVRERVEHLEQRLDGLASALRLALDDL
jgi:hypothetical protein